MTARLPTPGGDDGDWGDVLNDYLEVSLASDGTLNPNTVGPTQLQAGSVSANNIAAGTITDANISASAGIAESKVAGLTTDLAATEKTASKGIAGGYAPLDGTGKVPSANLPAGSSSTLASDTDVALTSPSAGQVLTYDATATKWKNQTPASGFADPTTTKGDLIIHGTTTTRQPIGSDGQVLTADSTQATGAKWAAAPTASNATTGTLGLIQLDGDLGGSATSPTVPGLTTKVDKSTVAAKGDLLAGTASSTITNLSVGSDGQMLTADSTKTAGLKWSTPAAGVTLDATSSDIQPLGSQAAGSVGKAADAGHVHVMPTASQVGAIATTQLGAAGGVATLDGSSQLTVSQLPSSVVSGSSVTKNSAYTLTSSDHVVLADATSATFTITLPTAIGFTGRYTVDAITSTANIVTLATTSGQTIDGAATLALGSPASGALYASADLISDGANWRVI